MRGHGARGDRKRDRRGPSRPSRERFDAKEANDILMAERNKVGNLADRVSDLEKQLAAADRGPDALADPAGEEVLPLGRVTLRPEVGEVRHRLVNWLW